MKGYDAILITNINDRTASSYKISSLCLVCGVCCLSPLTFSQKSYGATQIFEQLQKPNQPGLPTETNKLKSKIERTALILKSISYFAIFDS